MNPFSRGGGCYMEGGLMGRSVILSPLCWYLYSSCSVSRVAAGHSRGLGLEKDRRPGFPNSIPLQTLCPCLLPLARSWMTLLKTISIWVSDPAHSHSCSPRAGPSEGSPGTHRKFG